MCMLCCGLKCVCLLLLIFCFNKRLAYCEVSDRRARPASWGSCVSVSATDKLTTRQIHTVPLDASSTDKRLSVCDKHMMQGANFVKQCMNVNHCLATAKHYFCIMCSY